MIFHVVDISLFRFVTIHAFDRHFAHGYAVRCITLYMQSRGKNK